MDRGRDIIGERQIIRRQNCDDAIRSAHFRQINRRVAAARDLGRAKGQMERAGWRGDVVDIARCTCDMQGGGIVGQGFCDAHGATSNTFVCVPERSEK